MRCPRIQYETLFETDVTRQHIQDLLGGAPPSKPRAIGLSPGYTPAGNLTVLAVAVETKVLLIQFRSKLKKDTDAVITARELLQKELLSGENNVLFAFDAAVVAANLYYDTHLRVQNAIDIQDGCPCKENRIPTNAVEFALNTTGYSAYRSNITDAFKANIYDPSKPATTTAIVLKAWLSGFLPGIADMEERFREVKSINLNNTETWPETTLLRHATWARTDMQLDMKKTPTAKHDFTTVQANQNKFTVNAERFQNRFQRSNGPVQMAVTDSSGAQYTVTSHLAEVQGRKSTLKGSGIVEGKTITSLSSTEIAGPTKAEKDKAAILLRIFQQQSSVSENCFVKLIWPNGTDIEWPETMPVLDFTPPITYSSPLNESQQHAVLHMLTLNNSTRITMIQGPPGTGKTTAISAFVHSAIAAGFEGIWLVAQSNVAVRNIAEKLVKVGFEKWRLLVSVDFHDGWHEHLYKSFSSYVIRSDELPDASRQLQGCQVVLCTLSMLSSSRLFHITKKVALKTLVIDEASQINVNDYVSLFEKYPALHKICFIGDDKQLPPYGQEDVTDLKSIFEVSHLRSQALFLDTQCKYRMPPHIGDFISEHIYDGQLRSNPDHVMERNPACWFINIENGAERHNGTSWENAAERGAICKMAEYLQEDDASFRIITPYDAQRTALESDLKAAGLQWENKCFNVDSFQGNEDDIIIISLVRTQNLGFLKDHRRTNVMLSRCKKTMYICSSWDFLINGPGAKSLVGELAKYCDIEAWIPMTDVEAGEF
ncbi:hypothetical protein NM688_g6751 [Phlebia brevispora]|uniref:Uncharacterized protein n=1 Tax=Phlebia brevispora TaxID=194682 RepID=A0ACC1SD41_9APHY|nr:hypothetical protein NM688_g6751 [Phlebia brevispora]